MVRGTTQALALMFLLGLALYAVNASIPEQPTEEASVGEVGNWGGTGNAATNDPNRRMQELIHRSETHGVIEYEWKRIWYNDEYEWKRIWYNEQPSHLTPEQVHGGVQ